jgi:hypothetical protein
MSIPTDPPARRKIDPRQAGCDNGPDEDCDLFARRVPTMGVDHTIATWPPRKRATGFFAADAASRVRRRVNVWRRQVRSLIHPAEFASIEPVRS